MSPARTPHPDPNAEARQRRHATEKAKLLLREGMARLQAVLDDRFIIDETPLEASDAMQLAADGMHAALHQLDAADSMGRPGATRANSPPDSGLSWLPEVGQAVACGWRLLGNLKFVAAITERSVIEKILTDLGLEPRPPPRRPARGRWRRAARRSTPRSRLALPARETTVATAPAVAAAEPTQTSGSALR